MPLVLPVLRWHCALCSLWHHLHHSSGGFLWENSMLILPVAFTEKTQCWLNMLFWQLEEWSMRLELFETIVRPIYNQFIMSFIWMPILFVKSQRDSWMNAATATWLCSCVVGTTKICSRISTCGQFAFAHLYQFTTGNILLCLWSQWASEGSSWKMLR